MISMDLSDLDGFEKFNDLDEIKSKLEEAQKDDGYDKITIEERKNSYNGDDVLTLKSLGPYAYSINYLGEIKFDESNMEDIELYVYLPDGFDSDRDRLAVDYRMIDNLFEEGKDSFKDQAWKYFYSLYFTPSRRSSYHKITTDYDPIDYYKMKTDAYYNHYDGIVNIMRTPRYAYCDDPTNKKKFLRQVMRTDLNDSFIDDIIDDKYYRTIGSYEDLMENDINVPRLG